MSQIISDANDLLRNNGFAYAICGGFALDMFTNTSLRIHSDIDICVFECDKDIIYRHIKNNGWVIYEFHGQGIARQINDIKDLEKSQRNLMCVKNNCEIIEFFPCDKGDDFYLHKFYNIGISSFNYVEFLFNKTAGNDFIFSNNAEICRDINKAVLFQNDTPYLSPELVLLYSIKNINQKWYQSDYDIVISKMDNEQKLWFYNSLDKLYPNGHKWR
ncbi:MAG: hypothetical protein FWC95_03695 [Defluviitaleaceae bacterium]|nr:hypothetical protein [Defluviitaleaceae bacterium]